MGEKIKKQRKDKKMTQKEFSEITNIPISTISAYENDKVDIKGSVLAEISRFLGTTPNYLLGVEEDNSIDEEIRHLVKRIDNLEVKRILLVQIKALADY